MQALILAGARGQRLRPLTDVYPKPLLYLPGGTLLDYLLDHLRQLPLRRIGVVLHHQGDKVAQHLAGSPDVDLLREEAPFTLMSALASAVQWATEPTLVIQADSYFSTPLHYFAHPFLRPAAAMGEASFLVDQPNGHTPHPEHLAGAAAMILPPEAFRLAAEIDAEESFLPLVRALLARGGNATALPLRGWRAKVTDAADLLALNRALLGDWHEAAHPAAANIGYDAMALSWIAPDADVDEHGIGLYVTIGAGATVRGSHLHNSLIFPGATLHRFEAENAIIAESPSTLMRIFTLAPERA